MIFFNTLLPIVLLALLALFVSILLHEIGHAILPLITRNWATIYVGSYGNSDQCFRISLGQLKLYFTYNPFLWVKGCCVFDPENYTIDQKMLITALGPGVSVLLTVLSFVFLSAWDFNGIVRLFFGLVFFVSLMISLGSLAPVSMKRYTAWGDPIYNDLNKFRQLLRMKRGR
jgi:hypothetical protein